MVARKMRSVSWIGVGLLLLVSACSSDSETPEEAKANPKEQVQLAQAEAPRQFKVKSTPVWDSWKTSEGKVMAHGAAEIKNTGKKPVRFDSVQLRFQDKDGRLLAKEEVLAVVPKVIHPGESAYVGSTVPMEAAQKPEELREVTLHTEYHPAYKEPAELQVKELQRDERDDRQPVVRGKVANPDRETVQDVFVVTALKDKEGQLVAVIGDYLNRDIRPGDRIGFTAQDDQLPAEVTDQATQVEAHAYPLFVGEQAKK